MAEIKNQSFFFRLILRFVHRLHQTAPVRVKIMGIVVAFICLLGLSVIIEMRSNMADILSDQLKKRANAIASDVASRSTNLMLVGDTFSLYAIAKSIAANYDDVRYLLIMDEKCELVAHNFGQGVPVGLLEIRDLQKNVAEVIEIDTEEGVLLDVAFPIADGKAGWVRVGMSEASMGQTINMLSAKLVFTTVGISILGLLGAFGMSHLITRPIHRLVEASRAVANGDLTQRVSTQDQDEIGQLGRTFNTMAESLERYTQEREALLAELTEKEQVRAELLKKVITAQEEERKRISRELHDETSQSLTSLTVGLKVLSQVNDIDQSQRMAGELRDLASTTLQEVHRLAVELRPTVLDDMGLLAALERYIAEYRRKFDIEVDLHVQNQISVRLPNKIETALYRIVQEALTNVVKYASANNVSIVLQMRPNGVNLIIEDDGIGFDVERVLYSGTKEQHLGLAGMQERATLLEGAFTVESAPGTGTTIYVRLPLRLGWDDEGKGSLAVSR